MSNRTARPGPPIPLSVLEGAIRLSLVTARERHARLSRREVQVAGLLATGKPNRQIAEELGISPKTMSIHCINVRAKLEASTTASVANLVNLLRLADGAVPASDDGQATEVGGS
jgi:DNA-binding NarL/FixJ family response regulator